MSGCTVLPTPLHLTAGLKLSFASPLVTTPLKPEPRLFVEASLQSANLRLEFVHAALQLEEFGAMEARQDRDDVFSQKPDPISGAVMVGPGLDDPAAGAPAYGSLIAVGLSVPSREGPAAGGRAVARGQ